MLTLIRRIRHAADVHRSQHLNVHCGYAVVIRAVAASVTDIHVQLMVTIFFQNPPTLRTALTGIVSIYLDNLAAILMCLVLELLFQVIERPGMVLISIFLLTAIDRIKSYVSKILKHKESISSVVVDECLRQAVIVVAHPAVLSLTNLANASL